MTRSWKDTATVLNTHLLFINLIVWNLSSRAEYLCVFNSQAYKFLQKKNEILSLTKNEEHVYRTIYGHAVVFAEWGYCFTVLSQPFPLLLQKRAKRVSGTRAAVKSRTRETVVIQLA